MNLFARNLLTGELTPLSDVEIVVGTGKTAITVDAHDNGCISIRGELPLVIRPLVTNAIEVEAVARRF